MFKEVIEYDVPECHRLKEQFKAAAEITANGKIIKIGELTATNRSLEAWASNMLFIGRDTSRMWTMSSVDKNDDLHDKIIMDTEQETMIDLMAAYEAAKNVSESAKEQALADAMEKKAREIRAKGASLG